MLLSAKLFVQKLALKGAMWVARREYERQAFTRLNQHSIEYEFIFRQITERCPRTVLDVGVGTSSLPHALASCGCQVTATDNIVDYWPRGLLNRHYHVIHDNISRSSLSGPYDLVSCISMLQHVSNPDPAVANMIRLLRPGGHLVITTAYNERRSCEDCYSLPNAAYKPSAGYTCKCYTREHLTKWQHENGVDLVHEEFYRCWSGELWTQGEQVLPFQKVAPTEPHQYICFVLQKPLVAAKC